jgi:membrane associated rhomboid family serine protease
MPPRLNIPPITRILLIGLAVQSSLSAVIRYRQWTKDSDIVVPYLTLVPQLSIIYPWTFLTTTLVEQNVFTIGISGLTIYYGGRYLERSWSSQEFTKFLLIVSLLPNILTFAILVIMFYITQDMSWRYVQSESKI